MPGSGAGGTRSGLAVSARGYASPMSPEAVTPGSVRSAAQLNQDIRDLWQRAGGQLSATQRLEYQLLVTRWAAAVQAERAAGSGHDETAPAREGEGRRLAA